MINRANGDEGSSADAVRDAWRAQVENLTVDEMCGCGMCPSVSLTTGSTPASDDDADRVVLTATLNDALVLLFIDAGVPSYLELAPYDDNTVYSEFPDASALTF